MSNSYSLSVWFAMLMLLNIGISRAAVEQHVNSEFVSSHTCAQCHSSQYQQWLGSHHDLAMQKATAKTVLGDFNQSFKHHGEITTFYKKNHKYFIKTLGLGGKQQDYAVKYTFGAHPLQQYLLALPGGRLQALTIAWDVEKKKWFDLQPHEKITANDPLHWTKSFYNWNSNCAECHSTNIQKNYKPKSKTYHTTWAEINVGCQACHGPGKQHVAKNKGKLTVKQTMEICATCHSRRHHVSTEDKPGEDFYDHFMPSLLREDLYYPDGQIKDEVFVYGSFLQSKMARAGVTCVDCHNPHSLTLTKPGNGVCGQCHNNNSTKKFSGLKQKNYDTVQHTHHKKGSTGSQCVNCHMPAKAYMQIDYRHDHSFRIPRPDLSDKLGTPNACNQCHTDKSAAWATAKIKQWYGHKKYPPHYGELFVKARRGEADVLQPLIHLVKDKQQAAIVRATAVELLARFQQANSIQARLAALSSDHVLLRVAAVRSLQHLSLEKYVNQLAPLLNDPRGAVRIEAANVLAGVQRQQIPKTYQEAFKKALHEYQSLQEANLDMVGSYFNLANLYQKQGKPNKAIQSYQLAIDLDNSFYPASQNLAMLFHSLGKNVKAQHVLMNAENHHNDRGELYYSLGLLFAEQHKMNEARTALAKAALLLPNHARIQYNYALALNNNGDARLAEKHFLKAYALNTQDADVLYAVTLFYVQHKNWRQARRFAQLLKLLVPESARIDQLIAYIQARIKH